MQPSYSVLARFVYVLFGAAFFHPPSGLVLANFAIFFKKILTHKDYESILETSLPHEAAEILSPDKGQNRPVFLLVFLRLPKTINKGLLLIKFSMVGCILRLRSAAPLCGTENSMHPTARNISVFAGGLFFNKGHKPMRNYATDLANSSQINTPKTYLPKKAVFNLVTTKEILFKNLALPKALALFLSHPQARIKFSRMEGLK